MGEIHGGVRVAIVMYVDERDTDNDQSSGLKGDVEDEITYSLGRFGSDIRIERD